MLEQIAGVLDVRLALALLATLTSGIIRGYSGFAGGLLLVPIFVILFGHIEGIAVATIVGLIGTAQMVPRAIKIVHWPEVGPVAVAIAITTPIGVLFLVSADPALVRQGRDQHAAVSALAGRVTVAGGRCLSGSGAHPG